MADIKLNPTISLESFREGRDPNEYETVFIGARFSELLVGYNEGKLGFITEGLENDQVEDRLLGIAVNDTLSSRRAAQNLIGALSMSNAGVHNG
jgi:hypothetical protein